MKVISNELDNKSELAQFIDKELTRLLPQRCIKRILFVAPPDVDGTMFDYGSAKRGRCWNYPPYGVGIIASHLRNEGLNVQILNLNNEILKTSKASNTESDFDFENLWGSKMKQEISTFSPDIVGVTCMFSMTHKSTVNLCNNIKFLFPTLPIALGGVHITNCFLNNKMSESLLEDFSNVDFFFLYEAELAFKQFIKVVNKEVSLCELAQIYFNSSSEKLYFSHKEIPTEEEINVIPAHDLMEPAELSAYGVIGSFYCLKDKGTRFTTMLSNRGCRGQCTYCSVKNFNGIGVRHRSVQSVIDELIMLKEKYGIGHIMWLDDDFLHDHKRTLRLFSEMTKQHVGITWDCTNGVISSSCTDEIIAAAAESGCIGLNIGVESGNPEILKLTKKPGTIKTFLKAAEVLRKYEQINSRVFLMIGVPGETYRMILDTFNLALEMDLDWYNITIFLPLPNTPIFEYMVQKGLLDRVEFENIRYSSGAYGKIRQNVNRGQLESDFKNIFENKDLDTVPTESQLYDIWFFMNYYLNFNRLFKENRPVKLNQQFKYVQNIADLVAPDDPFAMYFCGYLQNKVLGNIDKQLIKRVEDRLKASEYWRRRFDDFDLSVNHLKTGIFPHEVEVVSNYNKKVGIIDG
ncbi:MAG: hypothetical protein A2W05_01885 [Candidatus Schekmanbacteria bacterium RBG_16_38_10]|uniref:Uncharacterized protein n=1 Tax=Candidatus Schekmanbacteria bacterium RBG_16_38_10 TaxID=1817879 RepID=A0A1F7RTH3_9BACT|nr:MAG: hypothetical protein A2W05_01885 [Candidatus Schekmanbacteria bacterium RBG_16_38_10]